MKPRFALKICLGTVTLALAAGSSTWTLRAGLVSPDGKLVAYTVPGYDQDANLYNEVFVMAGDGSSTKSLGRLAGERDQVSWIGNDRILLSAFAEADRLAVLDTTGRRLADIVLPSECQAIYLRFVSQTRASQL